MSAPYAPAPGEIGGYPWWLKLWPWTVLALTPVWLVAAVLGYRTVQLVLGPWFVGFAVGQAFWQVRSMRRDERRWRKTSEEYRRWWMRRHGS